MVTYDALSGVPQFQINYQNEPEKIQTLYSLFDILNSVEKPVLLAIDEFQQIRNYPEENMEALLRTHIQTLSNVNFIFCGSKRHLMLDIFANERAPFYRSTEFLALDKISEQSYSDFINRQFASDSRTITPEAIEYILEWTRRHTYQSLLPILVEKEVLTETLHDGNLNYRVSDIFFSHWLSLHF